MEYISVSEYLKQKYGMKVYKLSLSSGCSCPNRDGKVSVGGCIFCSEGGSGDFASTLGSIDEQIRQARERVDQKIPAKIPLEQRKYIAYFQSFTNTYGDVNRLQTLYHETIMRDEIVALSIGTRPDCLPDEMIAMLQDLSRESGKEIWIELGLQTSNEKTAKLINRGYSLDVFVDAYQRLKAAGLTVIVHMIVGLPGEGAKEILQTARFLSSLVPVLDGIKIQLLHVLKNTELANMYARGEFEVMTLDEYCDIVVWILQTLPKQTVIHRITGDGPKKILIAPLWSADKKRVMNTLNKRIREAI